MGPSLNSAEFRLPGNSEDLLRAGNKGTVPGSACLEGDSPSSSEAARAREVVTLSPRQGHGLRETCKEPSSLLEFVLTWLPLWDDFFLL